MFYCLPTQCFQYAVLNATYNIIFETIVLMLVFEIFE